MSSTVLQIQVIAGNAPLITINTAASSVSKVNVKNRVSLSGTVRATTSCKASWSVGNSANIDLNAITVAAYSKYVPSNVETTVNLVLIMSYGLPAVQTSYIFSLGCDSSTSSIVVSTNAAPIGGTFSVQPNEGEELNTMFAMTASEWMDIDLPLSFQFGYLTLSSSSISSCHILTIICVGWNFLFCFEFFCWCFQDKKVADCIVLCC
jgi:hypothetical protein